MNDNDVDLSQLFEVKQQEMLGRLLGVRSVVTHPGEKGVATEENWRGLLAGYLPNRYQVDRGFVVDVDGLRSDQIDAVVFDGQYSPMLFNDGGVRFIPAESVYAVLEVKQELNRGNLEYAANKVASVRRLRRTSVPIVHAGGEYQPKEPFRILGGILTTSSEWKPPLGSPFQDALAGLQQEGRLDFGCALQHGAFEVISRSRASAGGGGCGQGVSRVPAVQVSARTAAHGDRARDRLRGMAEARSLEREHARKSLRVSPKEAVED